MGIKIDSVNDGLPISVIVPLSSNRKDFFENMVLPMLEANNPNEIIINDNVGLAPKKRNDGYDKSTQPYIFFCDDDIILPANYLQTLYNILIAQVDVNIGYTYTGYYGIVVYSQAHPMGKNFTTPSTEFNPISLRQANYISTMTLIKREVFPNFDEKLRRFQDWDIWLTLLKNGIHGVLTKNIFFWAYYLDGGITSKSENTVETLKEIRNKHSL